jgi:hypothetical protein
MRDDSSFFVYETRPVLRPWNTSHKRTIEPTPQAADSQWLRCTRDFQRALQEAARHIGDIPEPGSVGAYHMMAKAIVRDAVVPRLLQTKASKRRPVMECWNG